MASGRLTLGELSAILSLMTFLINDTGELMHSVGVFLNEKHESNQFFRFLELQEQPNEGEKVEPMQDIELKHVTYRYPMTNETSLHDINLTMRKGEHIAVVGENGAGKSTLIKLLTNML